jgi:hypothetical protein
LSVATQGTALAVGLYARPAAAQPIHNIGMGDADDVAAFSLSLQLSGPDGMHHDFAAGAYEARYLLGGVLFLSEIHVRTVVRLVPLVLLQMHPLFEFIGLYKTDSWPFVNVATNLYLVSLLVHLGLLNG